MAANGPISKGTGPKKKNPGIPGAPKFLGDLFADAAVENRNPQTIHTSTRTHSLHSMSRSFIISLALLLALCAFMQLATASVSTTVRSGCSVTVNQQWSYFLCNQQRART
jgi:hypothetical protein